MCSSARVRRSRHAALEHDPRESCPRDLLFAGAVCVPPPLVCGVKLAKHVSGKERHDVSEVVCIRIQNTSRADARTNRGRTADVRRDVR